MRIVNTNFRWAGSLYWKRIVYGNWSLNKGIVN